MEQKLQRTLNLPSLVLFGLAYMTPMIVFGIYGVLANETKGHVSLAYAIALIAMLFTAYSYGQMVKAFPVSGSAYTFTRKSIHPNLGFLVGWSVLLDYMFLPMVIWLIGSVYLTSALPSVPFIFWVLTFILVTTLINIIGLKVTTRINLLMMIFQFSVIGLFIVLSIVSLLNGNGLGTLGSAEPFFSPDLSLPFALAGASIAAYSFLGFDAITTLSEETIDPKKTLPRAIFLIALIGGLTFVIVSYFIHLVFPDYTQFVNSDSAGLEIAKFVGGNLLSSIFLAGMITAQFASGLSAQASASRLLFAMGRDNVLPAKIFGSIHSKFKTPIFNIVMIAVIGMLALFMDMSTSTSFINFGAFITFTFVNLSVIGYYFIQLKKQSPREILLYLIMPAIGALLNIWLFTNLDKHALTLGTIWLVLGIVYLTFLTKGFKRLPPEMVFDEND